MADFETVGQKIDRELEKLRQFIATELRPTTERKTVEVLRKVSERLAALAQELEDRATRKK